MLSRTSSPALVLCCALVSSGFATQPKSQSPTSEPTSSPRKHRPPSPLLNSSEGLSVIGAALESRGPLHARPDCSHLVHAIYERAGYSYSYVSSADLYRGVPEFRHVIHPQPGDVVAWPGHVGIVVNPSQNTFFSSLRSGLGVESYSAPYWKERGQRRFYRYLKTPQEKVSNLPPSHLHRRPMQIPASSHAPSAEPL